MWLLPFRGSQDSIITLNVHARRTDVEHAPGATNLA
jgi:hypothetical protein